MNRVACWLVLAGVVLGFALAAPPAEVVAANDRPITMSEINRMVNAGDSPRTILEAMVERGVGFRVSSTAEKRLEKWGFSEHQVGLVKRIAAGGKVDLDAEPEAGGEGGDDAGDGPKEGDYPVGYASSDGFHAQEKKRIERAIEASLGYERVELQRVTLYCDKKRHAALVPMLRKLEAELIKKYPESLVNATKPDSAHIVIVDGESNWNNWVDACFDSYEKDGMKYRFGPEDDPRPVLKPGSGYMLPACTNTHANKLANDEAVARMAAFSVGFLIMHQAGGPKHPDGLQTGFGDVTEAMAMKTPSVTVTSYEKRDIENAGGWLALLRKRFKAKEITDSTGPWTYETTTMKIEHYVEAWGLVATLCEAPDKFAAAVELVRTGQMPMAAAIREVYGITDQQLLEIWRRYANQ